MPSPTRPNATSARPRVVRDWAWPKRSPMVANRAWDSRAYSRASAVRPDQQRTPAASCSIMPFAPPVAPLASLDQDLLAELVGPGQIALDVADVGQQPERPAQAADVADLGEGVRRAGQPVHRLVGPAVHERDPGQVLQRPRLAPAVAHLARPVQGASDGGLGLVVLAREDAHHADLAQGVGRPPGVAQPPGSGRRRRSRWPARRRSRPRPARSRPAPAGPGPAPPRRPATRPGRGRPRRSARASVVARITAFTPARPNRSWARRVEASPTRQPQRLAVEPFGHRQRLGHRGPPRRLAQPVQRQLGHVGRHPVDRPQIGHQVGRRPEVVGHHVHQPLGRVGAVGHGRGQVGGDAVVASGPVGLGQGAVGHLSDEVGPEHPVLAVDLAGSPCRPGWPAPARSR